MPNIRSGTVNPDPINKPRENKEDYIKLFCEKCKAESDPINKPREEDRPISWQTNVLFHKDPKDQAIRDVYEKWKDIIFNTDKETLARRTVLIVDCWEAIKQYCEEEV